MTHVRATLVIAKLDRLGRNVAFVANLIESGVSFLAVDAASLGSRQGLLGALADHVPLMLSEGREHVHHELVGVRVANDKVWIEVTAPPEIGIATVYDFDLMIWAASQINAAKEAGLATSPSMHFMPYDLLRSIKRGTSGRDYDRLRGVGDRLGAFALAPAHRGMSGTSIREYQES